MRINHKCCIVSTEYMSQELTFSPIKEIRFWWKPFSQAHIRILKKSEGYRSYPVLSSWIFYLSWSSCYFQIVLFGLYITFVKRGK